MSKSIQWKLALIYVLLILLAMQIAGYYLLQSLEDYYLTSFSNTLSTQANLVAGFVERYLEADADKEYVHKLVTEFGRQTGFEVGVFNASGVVISGTSIETISRLAVQSQVARALAGYPAEMTRVDPRSGERYLHSVVPVGSDGRVSGAVYLVGSLEGIYGTLGDVRSILFSGTIVALLVSVFVGLALARTITSPIKEVTTKAAEMAAGRFDQRIRVRSEDEIGQLGRMFNYLTERLRQTLSDITAEKGKLEAVLKHMTDGVLAVDSAGTVVLSNRAAETLVGQEELVGTPIQEIIPEITPTLLKEAAAGGPVSRRMKVGSCSVMVHLAAMHAPDPRSAGTVLVLQDITEQERLEKMRKDFVANVSHELRTPVTSIKSYIETLLDGVAGEDPALARRFLEVVHGEVDRMARLITDLLDLSTLDHVGAARLSEIADLGDLMQEVLDKLSIHMNTKGIAVSFRRSRGVRVLGDRDRLLQVFSNVLSNAVKYTGEGGAIYISVRRERGRVVVRVKDTGIGIPKEDLPRVFERFYRVDKARSRELGGTGLGLSIAREIVISHGGDIFIDSEVGRGTEVRIELPPASSVSANS